MDSLPVMHAFRNSTTLWVRAAILSVGALGACATPACTDPVPPGKERVTIHGRHFHLDAALDPGTREKGLGGVTAIDPDGGMVFVFTSTRPLHFVMRDCTIPIDVAFLSEAGTVLAWHAMVPEEPQREDEGPLAYENRLKKYSSGFPARFAVEVAGGTFGELGLKTGDQIDFDVAGLKARAR